MLAHPNHIHEDERSILDPVKETTKKTDKLDAKGFYVAESLASGATLLEKSLGGMKMSPSTVNDLEKAPNVLIRGDNRVFPTSKSV